MRNKRALVSESLGKIKVLERQQRETAGEEYTQGTIEDTDDLEKIIDSIIYSLEGISKLPLSEIENEMKFILEEKIDVEFRDSEGVQNSVSQPAASQADVFVQALGEVDGHL